MKRFKFGLEKVLVLRQYSEQEAKNELGRAIGILTSIENNIKINSARQNKAMQERFESISDSGNGALSMRTWDNYILRPEQEGEVLAEQAAEAELVVEEKRNLYLEAGRELKVMEKLKEKRQREYRKEMFAVETRELDEVRREAT